MCDYQFLINSGASHWLIILYFSLPKGLEDVSKYPDLFAELASRGWTDEEMEKLAGLNLIRAFRKIEEVKRYSTTETLTLRKFMREIIKCLDQTEYSVKERREFQTVPR